MNFKIFFIMSAMNFLISCRKMIYMKEQITIIFFAMPENRWCRKSYPMDICRHSDLQVAKKNFCTNSHLCTHQVRVGFAPKRMDMQTLRKKMKTEFEIGVE